MRTSRMPKATLRKLNLASESVGVIGAADTGEASVTVWVLDERTRKPVASVEMTEGGKYYQRGD